LKKKLTCIECPVGCILDIEYNKSRVLSVKGNECSKGEKFARDEIIDPRRVLTTTIDIESALFNRLPVRSRTAVPRDRVMDMIKQVKKIKVRAPVRAGDIIIKDFLESGIDIISSFTVEK